MSLPGAVLLSLALQQSSLVGVVRDSANSEPVAFARVTVSVEDAQVRQAVAGRLGTFVVTGIAPGTANVEVLALGYEPWQGEYGELPTSEVRVLMQRMPVRLDSIVVGAEARAGNPLAASTGITAPVHALPLDIARIIIGGVLFFYFLGALRQTRDFSDPDGLIDHRLSIRLLPPTRLSVFQPGMPGWLFRIVFLCACVASLFVVAGYHPRAAAAFMFLAAVANYRWNVLAAYLDDAMMHIFCLWLVLLPVGHTLTLPDLLAGGPAIREWGLATVPGLAPRAFLANMALVYVVAGFYKFTSPMWRDGSAMHAALRMPIARAPEFWKPRYRTPLRWVTHAALVMEPLFVLIFVLPAGSVVKWLLAAGAVIFHGGIALTLKIPYSNSAMLGALPLAFAPEIMGGAPGLPFPQEASAAGLAPTGVVAVALVVLIAIMLLWDIVFTGTRLTERYSSRGWYNPVQALLWVVGVYQSYRLFDWVDERNYHVRFEVRTVGEGERGGCAGDAQADGHAAGTSMSRRVAGPGRGRHVDPDALFPQSMRHLLLQSYLVGNIWLQLSPEKLEAVRRSLLVGHARRYARAHPEAGTIDVVAVVQRITADNLELTRGERRRLMRFTCRDGDAVMHFPS